MRAEGHKQLGWSTRLGNCLELLVFLGDAIEQYS